MAGGRLGRERPQLSSAAQSDPEGGRDPRRLSHTVLSAAKSKFFPEGRWAALPRCQDPCVQSAARGPSSATGDPRYNQQMRLSTCTRLWKTITGKQNKPYFHVEEFHSFPARVRPTLGSFLEQICLHDTRENLRGDVAGGSRSKRGEQCFHLDSSTLHTIRSWTYEKDCFYFIAEHMPQPAGSCFNEQL